MTRWIIALIALAVVFAWPMQITGYNQNAHYALVRALAVHGSPSIDQSRGEIGDLSTRDAARFDGHWYAAKAPGLAFLSLPTFAVVEAIGMRTTGEPTRVLWWLHLSTTVLPALLIVVLVRWVGDRLEPGFGAPAAISAGLATLLLPFATLYFAHVAAAAFSFAAFALLLRERLNAPSSRLLFAAGVLAGFAVVVDYPLALAAAILGLYVLVRPQRLARAAAYAAGALLGVLPLLLFNWWAFGSPTHIAYEDYYAGGGKADGLFGFGLPSASHARELLFSTMGLLVLTPVVFAAAAGIVLLLRRHRAEALTLIGVVGAYFLWNTSLRYASPFGGLGPPRYLLPLIPFLAVGLSVAYRRFPITTFALAAVSAVQMVVTTATGPLAAYDGSWMSRLRTRQFVATAASFVDVTGWYTIVVFFVCAAAAAAIGASFVRFGPRDVFDLPLAFASTALWVVLAVSADNPNGRTLEARYAIALAAIGAICAAATLIASRRPWASRDTLAPS